MNKQNLTRTARLNKFCGYCGLESWACGCGGHCYDKEEHYAWMKKYQ